MKLSFSVAVAMMIPFACLNARAGWFSFSNGEGAEGSATV